MEFRLPDVGEGLEEAEIVTWLVAVGDTIRRDQPLVEILTDKSATELPAPSAGTITKLGPSEGDIVPVGTLLVVIDDGTEDSTAPEDSADSIAVNNTAVAPPLQTRDTTDTGEHLLLPTPAYVASDSNPSRVKASPSTRKRAAAFGLDLSAVAGTGPGGRITIGDVEEALANPDSSAPPLAAAAVAAGAVGAGAVVAGAQAPTPTERSSTSTSPIRRAANIAATSLGQMEAGTHPLRGIRRAISQNMTRAWSTIPHIHSIDEIDASALLDLRMRMKSLASDNGATLTPLAFLVAAVATALRTYPMVNASLDADTDTITVHEGVNIGIAVATDDGLVVPVIAEADTRSVLELGAEISRLSMAARTGSLTREDTLGGTCTISNYGSLGGSYALPIIRPPEAAIVGFGAVRERPWVSDGEVVARPTLPVVVGMDHRLIDGDLSTAFHRTILELLAEPLSLVLPW